MRSTRIGFLCTRALFHLACRHSFAASHDTSTLPAGIHLLPRMTRWQERIFRGAVCHARPRRLACHSSSCIRAPSIFRAPFCSGMEPARRCIVRHVTQGLRCSVPCHASSLRPRVHSVDCACTATPQPNLAPSALPAPSGLQHYFHICLHACDGYVNCEMYKQFVGIHLQCKQQFLLLNKSC